MEVYKLRIDKWLWAVRIFKTRKLASDACKSGKVKIEGNKLKPSRSIQIGDRITVQKGIVKHEFEVTGLIEKRVSAAIAAENVVDHTPEEELFKLKSSLKTFTIPTRKKGEGRPTKKARRDMDKLKKQFE